MAQNENLQSHKIFKIFFIVNNFTLQLSAKYFEIIMSFCTCYNGHYSGGSRISRGGHAPVRGCGPPTWALFGKNVCENERIGSHRGAVRRARPPPQIRQCTLSSLFMFMYLYRAVSKLIDLNSVSSKLDSASAHLCPGRDSPDAYGKSYLARVLPNSYKRMWCYHDFVIGAHKRRCEDCQNMPSHQTSIFPRVNVCMSGGNDKAIVKIPRESIWKGVAHPHNMA